MWHVLEHVADPEAVHRAAAQVRQTLAPVTIVVNNAGAVLRKPTQDIRDDDDFLERLQELLLMESKGFPESHPFSKVSAMPSDVPLPPLYL
ncbi:MAG: hypothetical protein V4464_10330, partial [Pseudomonadota bacterium]